MVQGMVHNLTAFNSLIFIFWTTIIVDHHLLHENDKTVYAYVYCTNNFKNLPREISLEETGFLSRGKG